MSQYSLDSLDNDLSCDNKLSTCLIKDSLSSSMYDSTNLQDSGEPDKVNDPLFPSRTSDGKCDKDAGCNEWLEVKVATQPKDPEKSCGNALIASTAVDAVERSCLAEEKHLPGKLAVVTSNFRAKRFIAKKFDVARLSSSSPAEFRLGVSSPPSRKSHEDIEGFMKADKKLGKARRTVANKGTKKRVSYLELHRRKFDVGVESRRYITSPEGSTPAICGDRIDERLGYINEEASVTVSRDDESELDFYRRVMELGSRVPRETRSCEALEPDDRVSKSSCDVSECLSDVVQPAERRNRVFYKPYSIEDYKCLSVPQADRSLGPDRIEMESKGEWLMRRRSYGDSVSARNRQRILHRAQKLKESRRADVQKLRLPSLTDVKNPDHASKVDGKQEESEIIGHAKSSTRSKMLRKKQADTGATEICKSALLVPGGKTVLSKSKPESKVIASSPDLYETCSDTTEELMHLRNLRLRHIEEKKKIDQLFKRGLCA